MKSRVLYAIILAVVLSANSSLAAESPEDFLRGLYKMHIGRFKMNIHWFDKKKDVEKYFDTELSSLFLKDEQCKKKTREICNLDFDPILAAQDFDEKGKLNLKVQKLPERTKEKYKVTFNNMGTTTLVYELKQTSGGWRITDIIYSEGSPLRKILSGKP
jgi:hypothetical protein